jgi:hypothetical protein
VIGSRRIGSAGTGSVRQEKNKTLGRHQGRGSRQWRELELDGFWGGRLPPSRKGTRCDRVPLLLATHRLLAPGSEWRLHREWFARSAMADLLGEDLGLAEIHKLYR